jgi:hypothetical protein
VGGEENNNRRGGCFDVAEVSYFRGGRGDILQIPNQLHFFTKIGDFYMPDVKNLCSM